MKAIEIIDALFSGYNNVEQMGIYNPESGIEFFWEEARVEFGIFDPLNKYVYGYCAPLKNGEYPFMPDCILELCPGTKVYLYKIED